MAAAEWGFNVVQPNDQQSIRAALDEAAVDVAVVVAYGRILRPVVLEATSFGFVNVHFSLLPRWRGAAPVERALLAGDSMTGVTLMRLDEGMDTGPLLGSREMEVEPDDTGGALTARLAMLGAGLLEDVLPAFLRGRVLPVPQMESAASYAPRLAPADARIDASVEASRALRMIRAFTPRPGAWCVLDGVRTKIWDATESDAIVPVGHVAVIEGEPVMGLPGGTLRLSAMQPAGSRTVSGRDWANGRHGESAELSSE